MGHGRSAAYAARLLAKAELGNKACRLIAAAAVHELATLLRTAAGGGKSPVRIALAGGLMAHPVFRKDIIKAARSALPGRKLSFTAPRIPAQEAAARLAIEL
jgi:N-acetylglucosamine kinase-like BadF-type ATPase